MTKKSKYRLPLILAATCALGVLMILAVENFLIFYPDRYPVGNWYPTKINPEDAWIETSDGIKLHGWYVKAKDQKALAVYSHGNGGNITGLADYLQILSERLGISVLAYDYRGYGRSNSTPNIAGVLKDAAAATEWLAHREGTTREQIIQIGRSLGGGVAMQTAVREKARALILENTFTSLADMGKRIYPWLPVRLLMRQDLPSLDTVKQYGGPILIVHGDKDELVPESMGRELYAAANEPKQFVSIVGGGHNDFPPPYYFLEIERFLGRL
jgi:hypothetical protein